LPRELISHAVWLYFCFPLSFRHVEEMLEPHQETMIQSGQLKVPELMKVFPIAMNLSEGALKFLFEMCMAKPVGSLALDRTQKQPR